MGKKNKNMKRNRSKVRKRIRDQAQNQAKNQTKVIGKNKRRRPNLKKTAKFKPNVGTAEILKFGSINVDGMNEASKHSVEKLLYERKFDVSH